MGAPGVRAGDLEEAPNRLSYPAMCGNSPLLSPLEREARLPSFLSLSPALPPLPFPNTHTHAEPDPFRGKGRGWGRTQSRVRRQELEGKGSGGLMTSRSSSRASSRSLGHMLLPPKGLISATAWRQEQGASFPSLSPSSVSLSSSSSSSRLGGPCVPSPRAHHEAWNTQHVCLRVCAGGCGVCAYEAQGRCRLPCHGAATGSAPAGRSSRLRRDFRRIWKLEN